MAEIIKPHPNFRKVIPANFPGVDGYKEIPIHENREPLVPIGPFTDYRIYTNSIYFGERESSPYREQPVEGSNLTIFVRRSLAEQLVQIQKVLPRGIYVAANDGYRSYDTQDNLFKRYKTALAVLHPDWSDERLEAHTVDYVSKPSKRRKRPSTHLTGGSVDIVLLQLPKTAEIELRRIDRELDRLAPSQSGRRFNLEVDRAMLMSGYAIQLPFATNFDYGREEAALDYLENEKRKRELTSEEIAALNSTRMLEAASVHVGLRALRSEWWHKNSVKTQMGAKIAGLPFAEFGPKKLSRKNLEHEQMRRAYLAQTPGWEKTQIPVAEIILP